MRLKRLLILSGSVPLVGLVAMLCLVGCRATPEPGTLPNLVISQASLDPPQFTEGDTVTLYYTIKNVGKAKAEPRPAWNVGASDGETVRVAPGAPGTSLEPGATTPSYQKFVWEPRCNTKIRIQVDPGNQIKESDELDNTWELTLDSSVCAGHATSEPELAAFYQACVDRVNKLRALEGLPPLMRDQGHQDCSNSDAKVNFEKDDPHYSMCGQAQNTCPSYPSLSSILDICIEQNMYHDEKVCYGNNPGGCYYDTQCMCGHYVNMTDKGNMGFTKVACGVHITPSGQSYVVINFFK